MIYRRRALQRRLNDLRDVLGDEAVDKLAERLNRPGKDRVAAMWEVVVMHGLSKCGSLQNEVALASMRRPDILFEQGALRLTARKLPLISDTQEVELSGIFAARRSHEEIQVQRGANRLDSQAG